MLERPHGELPKDRRGGLAPRSLFPISDLHSAILNGHVDGKPFYTETTLLPFTKIIEWTTWSTRSTLESRATPHASVWNWERRCRTRCWRRTSPYVRWMRSSVRALRSRSPINSRPARCPSRSRARVDSAARPRYSSVSHDRGRIQTSWYVTDEGTHPCASPPEPAPGPWRDRERDAASHRLRAEDRPDGQLVRGSSERLRARLAAMVLATVAGISVVACRNGVPPPRVEPILSVAAVTSPRSSTASLSSGGPSSPPPAP